MLKNKKESFYSFREKEFQKQNFKKILEKNKITSSWLWYRNNFSLRQIQ